MNTIIDNFKSVYSVLNASNVEIIGDIYDEDIIFIDPFHEIRGLKTLVNYFSDLYTNVDSCQFSFKEVYSGNSSAMITWNMAFRHPALSKATIEVPGTTEIRFADRIFFHRDYFDAGKMIYENIPVVGSIVKYIKRRI